MSNYERIAKVIRHIDESFLSQPNLNELAKVAGLSASHFHRMFAKWAGVTPKDFVQALTMDHAERLLKDGASVLNTSLESGLSGPSRLHDLCISCVAATPGELKRGGKGMEIKWGLAESPFGKLFLAQTLRGISHLSFFDNNETESLNALNDDWPNADLKRDDKGAEETCQKIFEIDTENVARLRLHLKGTEFQLKVWRGLLEIPNGDLTSYSRIAENIGMHRAARAVGNAIGRNRISYLIPCHRVIRETGILGGYRWGTQRKRAMLAWEKAKMITRP